MRALSTFGRNKTQDSTKENRASKTPEMTLLEKAKLKLDAELKKAEEAKKAIQAKIDVAKKRVKQAEERVTKTDRKNDARRKIIAGAIVLAKTDLWKSLSGGVSEKDRHLFPEIWPNQSLEPKLK